MKSKPVTWEEITDTLIKEIRQNQYGKDEKMPSENDMAARFGVSRAEIRRAYGRLKELGYIYSMQGYGSFFSGKKEKLPLQMNDSLSFTEKMKNLDVLYESKNIEARIIKYNSLIYDMLEAPPDTVVYKILRLRMINGEPAAIHTSYLPQNYFPKLHQDASKIISVYEYIRSCGYENLVSDKIQLSLSPPGRKERDLLKIPGYESCLVLSEICISRPSGTILEVARTVYRSDRFIFQL
ncbi:GntR family transcriptional regulator [Diplocloster agilis]|uniref:GntR family transcriptional regulator n=1 Tax=Diplocloster agilis TaxID=2850323 RepID=UPI000820EF22|nr:GntR family transcriptional regulator [Suonthocola fibrivorans]MCU6732271.1 GntR family transcriptional regulator [Suonthocola fibrivorans]SCI38917.1 HTH-type transcriptional repressor yvoA [uncultured Clostridium sp.]